VPPWALVVGAIMLLLLLLVGLVYRYRQRLVALL
jgi:NADH:ubiquinone oxidoreductase subunit 3 (subunit A)